MTLPFADKVEIESMNFINKTPYIYYKIKNLATGKYNYGIMDLLSQQILFNTDQDITHFEPLSNHEMLIFSNGEAYKICLFRNGDSCEASCPSGTSLVLDVTGNRCESSGSSECALKLVPENICIDSCDTDIYKLSADGKSCGLCEYFENSKPYRLIKTEECLDSKPEGTKFYNEKYKLLECASGYQFDSVNKLCVPHCYSSCLKCTEYSEDSENHYCLECKEGYYLNGTNCYEIIKPTTIIEPPTTVIEPPSTITKAPSTAIESPSTITKTPSTVIEPPSTIIKKAPSTITEQPSSIIKKVPSTITEQPSSIIKKSPSSLTEPSTTIIKKAPSTIVESLDTTISRPKTSDTPTSKPSPTSTNIPSSSPKEIPTEALQSTVLVEKCLNGQELNQNCRNLTNAVINTKLKEEILSSYSPGSAMRIVKEEKIFVQATDTATELRSLGVPNNDGVPAIDLGYCETLLRQANNISEDKNLIIIKLGENDDNNRNKNLNVDVYNPITFQKLNLSICDNSTVDLYVPLVMSSEQSKIYDNLVDDGYEPFNLRDKFYRELCTPYTSENGTDVLLDEREEFVYSTLTNETNCYDNCKYISYSLDTKYMRCECPVNETYTTLDMKHISGNNIAQSFMSVFKSTNYKVMICYNLVFNFKIFCHNYGSILALICFVVYLIFMFICCGKGITPLKKHISKIIFKETEDIKESNKKKIFDKKDGKGLKFKEKTKPEMPKDKNEHNPPKKFKSLKIKDKIVDNVKTTEDTKLVNHNDVNPNKKRKSRRGSKRKSTNLAHILPKDKLNNVKKNNLVINSKILNNDKEEEEKRRPEDLDMYELNELNYDDACELDNRGFCKTYWSVLMREHLVLLTFFNCYDYNLFYVKIEKFFILICTQMTINGLFFIHESMYRKSSHDDDLTFVEKIPQLLFTLIGAHIIEVILCFLSMTDVHVYEIKALPKEEKNSEKVINIMDKMKRKLVWFFVLTLLLFLFYWYFISAFCAVYQNTQIIFLRDSGISILTSFIDPFIIYGITTLLRSISLLSCCKKKCGCIYALSGLFPIF